MSMDSSKLSVARQTTFIGIHQFSSMIPMLVVESSGSILANAEIGLSANTDSASLEGGTGITAQRILKDSKNPVGARDYIDPANLRLRVMGATGLQAILFPTGAINVGPRHFMPIPSEWDKDHPVYVYVYWECGSGQQAASVTWRLLFEIISLGSSPQWGGTPLGQLDTAISAVSPVTAGDVQYRTGPGVFAAKRFKTSSTGVTDPVPRLLSFALGTAAISGWTGGKTPFLYGIEFEYTPRWGRGKQIEAPAFAP